MDFVNEKCVTLRFMYFPCLQSRYLTFVYFSGSGCAVLQEACKTYNIDLISVDLSQRIDSMLFGKSARAAIGCVSVPSC